MIRKTGAWTDPGFPGNPFLRLAGWAEARLPEAANPFTRLGALANLHFLIAIVTGVLSLLWYKPSVHDALASVRAMESQRALGGLVQSLHRYSADACMLFLLIHGLEALFARRIQRPRALAWLTGLALAALLWVEGWIGYGLVWDERAGALAMYTARLFDGLPIFESPLSRSFLSESSLSSLFFFVIFFIHMLFPLGMGMALWLHVTRVNRPRILPGRPAALLHLASLAALALALPARAGQGADLGRIAGELRLDILYMLPFASSRFGGQAAWVAAIAFVLLGLAAFPFLFGRMRVAKPKIIEASCIGCNRCYEDCPFNAISMVPDERGDPKAVIDPDKCLACGNCAGACNPQAVEFPGYPVEEALRLVETWFRGKGPRLLAFLCRNAAAGKLSPDPVTGLCPDLPGYRGMVVPCSGWILPRVLEFAARAGCRGALIGGCGPGTPTHRLGNEWTFQRLMGKRMPTLSPKRVEGMEIGYAMFNRPELAPFLARAQAFRQGTGEPAGGWGRPARYATALACVLAFLGALHLASRIPFAYGEVNAAKLAVSLHRSAGQARHAQAADAEQAKLLPHMRGARELVRERRETVLEVGIDGATALRRAFPPRGLFRDGPASGLAEVEVAPGRHRLTLSVWERDSTGALGMIFSDTREIGFAPGRRVVALAEGTEGFVWP